MINLKKQDNIFLGYSRIDANPVYKYLRGDIPKDAIRVYNSNDNNGLYFKLKNKLSHINIDKTDFINFLES